MNNTLKKIFNSSLLLFLFIFPLFIPTVLKFIPSTVFIYNILQYFKLFSILILLLFYILSGKYSKIMILVLLFCIANFITSAINGVINASLITDSLLYLGFAVIAELALKYNFEKFANVSFKLLAFLGIINFILILIYPNGLNFLATLYKNSENPHYFLCIDNAMFRTLAPLLFFSFYYFDKYKSKYLRFNNLFPFAMIIMVGLSLIIVKTGAGIGSYGVAIILAILYMILKKKCNITIYFIGYFLFFLVIILLNNQHIASLISSIFGRSITFTGRASLWEAALDMIYKSPIVGYGNIGDAISIWGGYFSSHNLLLDLCIHGGIISVFFFVLVWLYSAYRKNNISNNLSNIIFIMTFAIMINGLLEAGITSFLFTLFVLSADICLNEENQVSLKTNIYRF